MTALAYTSAIQTRVYSKLGLTVGTTGAGNKTLIDTGTVADPPAGGVALDAYRQIQQVGQWFSMSAPTAVPSEWEPWLVAKIVLLAGKVIHPEREQSYQRDHDEAEMAAIDAYARNLITYDPGATPEASALTVQNIRYYVVSHLVRRDPGWETVSGTSRPKPRKFVPFEIIDANIERVLRRIWQYGDWPFARRPVRISIVRYSASNATYTAASKTVTSVGNFATTIPAGAIATVSSGTGATLGDYVVSSATADTVVLTSSLATGNLATGDITITVYGVTLAGLIGSESFASFASRKVYFDDSTAMGAYFMEWFKDPDDLARKKAYDQTSSISGRPRQFAFTDSSGTLTWQFSPPPDQTYTAKAVVLLKGPTLGTLTDTTTAMARFPAEFNHVIKDAVLAETLRHIGDREGQRLWDQVTEEIDRMLPVYCDPGAVDNASLETQDVYNDFQAFTGGTSTFGGYM